MGTWAVDAFGNDYAQDWAEDLHETSNLDAVEDTLNTALDAAGELDAPFAAEALVAIEVLARLQGKGGAQTDDSAAVDQWVEARKPKVKHRADLADKAARALDRILAPDSELRQLWEESEHYSEWQAAVADLRTRL
jgi:ABC-type transporter Mla subunit MlaD